jgi:drug/metabolite transporter (DMT)-like permease
VSHQLIAKIETSSYLPYTEALLCTFLWSSSYVLVKVGLAEIPPFAFAAMRYALAFSILGTANLLLNARAQGGTSVAVQPSKRILLLLIAGLSGYTLAQGLQFLGLVFLPAVTTTFLLNFSPVFVLALGILFLNEKVLRIQLLGLGIAIIGAYAFLSQGILWAGEWFSALIVLASGLFWAVYMVTVRKIQVVGAFSSLQLTITTMGIGTLGLLILAVVFDGFGPISVHFLVIVGWLGVVNTALPFFLWNHALRIIRPYELSVLQNTMLVQTAILAWIFLGEHLTNYMMLGLVLVTLGVILVQIPAINKRKALK